jgi:hypothetical protein
VTRFVIQDTSGSSVCFEAESRDPKISTPDLCKAWLQRLRAAHATYLGDFGKASNTALLM